MIGLGRMEMGVDDSNAPEPAPFALPATVAQRDFAQSPFSRRGPACAMRVTPQALQMNFVPPSRWLIYFPTVSTRAAGANFLSMTEPGKFTGE